MIESVLAFARRVRTNVGGERTWAAIRPVYWKTISAMIGVNGAPLSFPDGYSYRIAPHFYAWQMDKYEPAVVSKLMRTLTETSVLYDVGAHVGILTIMAARRVGRVACMPSSQHRQISSCSNATFRLPATATAWWLRVFLSAIGHRRQYRSSIDAIISRPIHWRTPLRVGDPQ
jgi:hypothetical protein